MVYLPKDTLKDVLLRVSHHLATGDEKLRVWKPDFMNSNVTRLRDYINVTRSKQTTTIKFPGA